MFLFVQPCVIQARFRSTVDKILNSGIVYSQPSESGCFQDSAVKKCTHTTTCTHGANQLQRVNTTRNNRSWFLSTHGMYHGTASTNKQREREDENLVGNKSQMACVVLFGIGSRPIPLSVYLCVCVLLYTCKRYHMSLWVYLCSQIVATHTHTH